MNKSRILNVIVGDGRATATLSVADILRSCCEVFLVVKRSGISDTPLQTFVYTGFLLRNAFFMTAVGRKINEK